MGTPGQFGQKDAGDAMQMSFLADALPSVQSPVYTHGQQYPVMTHHGVSQMTGPYGSHHPSQMPPYAQYHQGHVQIPVGLPYQAYGDQQGGASPYNPAQYSGSAAYHPSVAQPYPVYPGYGPPSPAQQRGFQALPMYPGTEYVHGGVQSAVQAAQTGSRGHEMGSAPQHAVPATSPSIPATPRGPPRKPKQSGHALWVGNLPPGTQVGDLKDHFSREATKDIVSVFLISKSNCAFVNYRTEEACTAAMTRFHDSRFQGVRLVCRLRKSSTAVAAETGPVSNVPSGPAALQSGLVQTQTAVEAIAQNRESSQRATEAGGISEATVNDKYFIVKSLTIEDLELSTQNGIWATQSHNEDALNRAYETTESVYLIFSANKSGEYFGYARMESAINDETARTLEWRPYENHFAPKGRIIDDSARGTIFWEADTDEDEIGESIGQSGTNASESAERLDTRSADTSGGAEYEEEEQASVPIIAEDDGAQEGSDTGEASHQPFGRPFKVRWISTAKLPFYRTRGLRNPWNANREVKIARDGTELETSVGRRLVAMFYRLPSQASQGPMVPSGVQVAGQVNPQLGFGMPPYPGRY